MKYTELLKSIEKGFEAKINGTSRVKKADAKFIPGLLYSLAIYGAAKRYYEIVIDNKEQAARATFDSVNNALKEKITGGNRCQPVTDNRLPGIEFALQMFKSQKRYHVLQVNRKDK